MTRNTVMGNRSETLSEHSRANGGATTSWSGRILASERSWVQFSKEPAIITELYQEMNGWMDEEWMMMEDGG